MQEIEPELIKKLSALSYSLAGERDLIYHLGGGLNGGIIAVVQ